MVSAGNSNVLIVFCDDLAMLALWHPLLSYGYSCKASCARPG